jgi:hypothetical protein
MRGGVSELLHVARSYWVVVSRRMKCLALEGMLEDMRNFYEIWVGKP